MSEPVNPYESPSVSTAAEAVVSEEDDRRDEGHANWICSTLTLLHIVPAALVWIFNIVVWLPSHPPFDDLTYIFVSTAFMAGLGWAAWRRIWLVIFIESVLIGSIAATTTLIRGFGAFLGLGHALNERWWVLPVIPNLAFVVLSTTFAVLAAFCFVSARLAWRMRSRADHGDNHSPHFVPKQ